MNDHHSIVRNIFEGLHFSPLDVRQPSKANLREEPERKLGKKEPRKRVYFLEEQEQEEECKPSDFEGVEEENENYEKVELDFKKDIPLHDFTEVDVEDDTEEPMLPEKMPFDPMMPNFFQESLLNMGSAEKGSDLTFEEIMILFQRTTAIFEKLKAMQQGDVSVDESKTTSDTTKDKVPEKAVEDVDDETFEKAKITDFY